MFNKKISWMKMSKNKIQKLSPTSFIKENVYDKLNTIKKPVKKKKKISSENFIIPEYKEYNLLLEMNFNVRQLKEILKHYKQKKTGNKQQLIFSCYNYLKYSYYSIKIQRIFRSRLARFYIKLKGPGFINRTLCVNETDFLLLQDIKTIKPHQFFSFKENEFIYGFDICSFYNLLKESTHSLPKNPYNRSTLTPEIINNFHSLISISKILKKKTNILIENDLEDISLNNKLKIRTTKIFQDIDRFGHVSDTEWFLSLTQSRALFYLKELSDVWNYRLQLSNELKREICYPTGNPFSSITNYSSLHNMSIIYVKNKILDVISNMIYKGINENSKALGAYYVLGVFTIVNQNAAITLPWLTETFAL